MVMLDGKLGHSEALCMTGNTHRSIGMEWRTPYPVC
jgi:hypothetical protein